MSLELFTVEKIDHLVRPEDFDDVTPDSSALRIFTDFQQHRPLVIDADVRAIDAEEMMLTAHVRLKLVVDKRMEFVGTVSLRDVSPQNIMRKVSTGVPREDIRVADLMQSRLVSKALSYKALRRSTIAEVIDTLRQHGQQHCLVVDRENHHIRGIISASDIARRLHIPIVIHESPTFVDIFTHHQQALASR